MLMIEWFKSGYRKASHEGRFLLYSILVTSWLVYGVAGYYFKFFSILSFCLMCLLTVLWIIFWTGLIHFVDWFLSVREDQIVSGE